MLRISKLAALLLLVSSSSFAAINNISEEDGSPSVYPWKLKVTNGTLTNNNDGTASLDTGGGSGGLAIGDAITGGTASRVLYEDSGNLLAESANLTFNGTTLLANTVDINGGTIDGTKIGSSSAADATFAGISSAIFETNGIPYFDGVKLVTNAAALQLKNTKLSVGAFGSPTGQLSVTNLSSGDPVAVFKNAGGQSAAMTRWLSDLGLPLAEIDKDGNFDINGGTIDGTKIGASAAADATFSTVIAASIQNTKIGSRVATDATFTDATVNDTAYGAGWNGNTTVPTKNAVYDKIETISGGGLVVGTTAITSGTAARMLFEGVGNVLQEDATLTFNETTDVFGATSVIATTGTLTGTNALRMGTSGSDFNVRAIDDYTATANGVITWDESENTWVMSNRGVDDAAAVFSSAMTFLATDSTRAARLWLQGNNTTSVGLEIAGGPLDYNYIAAVGSGASGLFFHQTNKEIWPYVGSTAFSSNNGSYSDDQIAIGNSSRRFTYLNLSREINLGSDLGGKLNVDGSADEVQVWVQGHSTQTSNIILAEKSDGTDLFTLNNTGTVTIGGTTTSISAANSLTAPYHNFSPVTTIASTGTVGQAGFDTNAHATGRGAVQINDGTANTYLVGVQVSSTPSNSYVPIWNTGGTITWGAQGGLVQTATKTAAYTAVAGDWVLADANGAAGDFAVTLPASPVAGDRVRVSLITEHATRKVTIADNGNAINGGSANDVYYTLLLNGDSVEFTYIGGSAGWTVTFDGIIKNTGKIRRDAAQTINAATLTKVLFDAEEYDIGGIGDITTNDRIDIRRAGYYRITMDGAMPASSGGARTGLILIYKNGTETNRFGVGLLVGSDLQGTLPAEGSTEMLLAVGDYIEMYLFQASTAAGSNNTSANVGLRPEMVVTEIRL